MTHESLFEHWARYRTWSHDSLNDQRLHNRLMEAAHLWVQSPRSPGRLWRPPDLDLLHGLQQRCSDDLTQLELEFCQASEQQHSAELAAKAAAERHLAEGWPAHPPKRSGPWRRFDVLNIAGPVHFRVAERNMM